MCIERVGAYFVPRSENVFWGWFSWPCSATFSLSVFTFSCNFMHDSASLAKITVGLEEIFILGDAALLTTFGWKNKCPKAEFFGKLKLHSCP